MDFEVSTIKERFLLSGELRLSGIMSGLAKSEPEESSVNVSFDTALKCFIPSNQICGEMI